MTRMCENCENNKICKYADIIPQFEEDILTVMDKDCYDQLVKKKVVSITVKCECYVGPKSAWYRD